MGPPHRKAVLIVVNIDGHRYNASVNLKQAITECCAVLASPLSEEDATEMARRLKSLADPTRLRLVSIIATSPGGEACVCQLVGPLGVSQPTVSHHLKVLTDAGVVRREQRGTWAWFSVDRDSLAALSSALV